MWKLNCVSKLMILGLLCGQFYSSPSYAEGADGSGGGNGTKSTKEEVLEVLEIATPRAAILGMNAKGLRFERIRDPELKEMVAKVILPFREPPFSAVSPPIHVQNEPCKENGKDKDMSTEFRKGATICVSVGMLQRYSKESLHRQIIALMMHEMAHQYGYGEKAAKKLQDLYLRAYELPFGFSGNWANVAGDPLGALVKIEKQNPDVWKKKAMAKKWLQASQDVCAYFGQDINVFTSPIEKAAHLENVPSKQLKDILGSLSLPQAGLKNENIQIAVGRVANPCRLKGEAAYDLPRIGAFRKVREYISKLSEDYILDLSNQPGNQSGGTEEADEESVLSGTGSAE